MGKWMAFVNENNPSLVPTRSPTGRPTETTRKRILVFQPSSLKLRTDRFQGGYPDRHIFLGFVLYDFQGCFTSVFKFSLGLHDSYIWSRYYAVDCNLRNFWGLKKQNFLSLYQGMWKQHYEQALWGIISHATMKNPYMNRSTNWMSSRHGVAVDLWGEY